MHCNNLTVSDYNGFTLNDVLNIQEIMPTLTILVVHQVTMVMSTTVMVELLYNTNEQY